jgi:hypothetical protein
MMATHAIPTNMYYNARLLIKYELDVNQKLIFAAQKNYFRIEGI